MSLTLCHAPGSPSSRCALLTARNLNLDIDVEELHKIVINPLYTGPVLIDNEVILTEASSIAAYLVNSKRPGSTLYPVDPIKRMSVDARLYHDSVVLLERFIDLITPLMYNDLALNTSQETYDKMIEMLNYLDLKLTGKNWFVGDCVTIADLSILANVTSIMNIGYDLSVHKNLSRWYEYCRYIPGFEENETGATALGEYIKYKIEHKQYIPFKTAELVLKR